MPLPGMTMGPLGMGGPPPGAPGMLGLAAGQGAPPPGMPPGAGLLGALGVGMPPEEPDVMAPDYAGPVTPDGLMGLEGMDRDNAAGSALLALLQGSPLFPESPPPPGRGAGMALAGVPGMPPASPLGMGMPPRPAPY